MNFSTLFDMYIDPRIKADEEAAQAIAEFRRNIPGRVLQIDFDPSHSNKQGIKDGDKVYKMGLDVVNNTVFIQYFDNCNQGQPTMAIYADRKAPSVAINGWQVDKRFFISYYLDGDTVKKKVTVG